MKPYYIENIPPLLDKWGLKMGAAIMRFWQTGDAFQKDKDGPFCHRVRMIDHDHLSRWRLTAKHPTGKKSNLIVREPWLNDRKGDVIRNIQAAWKTTQHDAKFMFFPDSGTVFTPPGTVQKSPGISNKDVPFCDPSSNDSKWADAVDAFGLFDEASSRDGLTLGEAGAALFGANDLKDDYALALGKFEWRFLPMGRAALIPANAGVPDLLSVTFTDVGIYAFDSYDFNSDQPLGLWDVDTEELKQTPFRLRLSSGATVDLPRDVDKDPAYRPKMGLVSVTNASFRCYRDKLRKGRDLLVYSNVKRISLAGDRGFSFELQSGKPV
jgi:hypothetical protein